jgi:hypothetical protein
MVPSKRCLLAFVPVFVSVFVSSGCGGSKVDVTTPVQVTDEMERQAKASDQFISGQGKTKGAAKDAPK